MIALVLGIFMLSFGLYAVLPFSWALGWGDEVLAFLKGGLPLLSLLIGMVALSIGVADIKDRKDAKKEEAAEEKKE